MLPVWRVRREGPPSAQQTVARMGLADGGRNTRHRYRRALVHLGVVVLQRLPTPPPLIPPSHLDPSRWRKIRQLAQPLGRRGPGPWGRARLVGVARTRSGGEPFRARGRCGIAAIAASGDLAVRIAHTVAFDDACPAFATLTGTHPAG